MVLQLFFFIMNVTFLQKGLTWHANGLVYSGLPFNFDQDKSVYSGSAIYKVEIMLVCSCVFLDLFTSRCMCNSRFMMYYEVYVFTHCSLWDYFCCHRWRHNGYTSLWSQTQGTEALSPFLIGRTFVPEHSWEYSANIVGS